MGRSLTAYTETEIAKLLTQPYYLIELMFSVPLYYSTLFEQTIDGNYYSSSRKVTIANIHPDMNGDVKRGAITLDNVDNAISVVCLNESPAGLVAKVYKVYGTSPSSADRVLLFSGVMGRAQMNDKTVKIGLTSKGAETLCPGLVISKPVYNWLPAVGTIIKTGNTTITLRQGR